MEKYDKQQVESMLRNYSLLENTSNDDFKAYKMDLDKSLKRLNHTSSNLYKAVVGVFIFGNAIQTQAATQKVSKRQTIRRLDDGIHMLTMIMNGEF